MEDEGPGSFRSRVVAFAVLGLLVGGVLWALLIWPGFLPEVCTPYAVSNTTSLCEYPVDVAPPTLSANTTRAICQNESQSDTYGLPVGTPESWSFRSDEFTIQYGFWCGFGDQFGVLVRVVGPTGGPFEAALSPPGAPPAHPSVYPLVWLAPGNTSGIWWQPDAPGPMGLLAR